MDETSCLLVVDVLSSTDESDCSMMYTQFKKDVVWKRRSFNSELQSVYSMPEGNLLSCHVLQEKRLWIGMHLQYKSF